MNTGHIVLNSRKAANQELNDAPEEVFCTECREITRLKIVDCGFGDAFGGVSYHRVVTECCEATEWIKPDCEGCGYAVEKLIPRNEIHKGRMTKWWYCAACTEEMEKEVSDGREKNCN